MKHIASTTKQARTLEHAPPESLDSVTDITTTALEQSMDDQTLDVCGSTGIQNEEVASRLLCQVATAQVWPRPTDKSLDNASALIGELAPQNALEAMQKLKGKASPQNLSVGQVNVHQGGQAIVGSLGTSKERR